LIDRLHSDAKFKNEMRVIYDQVKAEKELKECTFVPNKGRRKSIPRQQLAREQSERAIGMSKQLSVSLVRKEGTETEIGTVKELRNDTESSKKGQARKMRNVHRPQNSANQMILEDVMEMQEKSAFNEDDARDVHLNTLSKESVNSRSNKKTNNAELFEYLAYNGVKNQKAIELQKLKNRKDLENCTFRPQIIKYQRTYENNKNVYENLLQQQKDYRLYEQAKREIELKDCSFQPTIDKKSERIAKQTREAPPEKSYEILHKKHQQQLDKAKKLVRDKESKEMSECTFTPQLLARQKGAQRSMQQQTTVPVDEQKIQMPVQSFSGKMKHNKYKTDQSGDADSVDQSVPHTMMMKHQASMPNLPKRKSKHERQAQNAQSMLMSRSNSSSMVAANQAAINQTQQAQHNYAVSGAGKSSHEPSNNFKGNAYPPPSGYKRHNKYGNANRSPEAPEAESGEPRPFKSSFAGAAPKSKF
jgi:hypothetical protein